MRVLGVRTNKDGFEWALVVGDSPLDAVLEIAASASAPAGQRGAELSWFDKELEEVLRAHNPDAVALRPAEAAQSLSSSILARAEMDGILLSRCYHANVSCEKLYSATLRSIFKVKSRLALDEALLESPAVSGALKTKRDAVSAAVAYIRRHE